MDEYTSAMKILALALLALQLVDFSLGQCASGWEDKGGQCMKCSSAIGAADATFPSAQGTCSSNGGNLATIINSNQEAYAFTCRTATKFPWIGYLGTHVPRFFDGTEYVTFGGVTLDLQTSDHGDCWTLDAVGDWGEQTVADCAAGTGATNPFVCSRPYESCYDLEVSGEMSVVYTHSDTSTQVDGKKWVGTSAEYSCSTGYSVSGGNNPRTCQGNGSWNGSEPACVASAVCSALTAPSDSTISYSTTASDSSYTTGTVATQVCNSGYNKGSGTNTRTCQSTGTWTESAIVCEKDNTDELAIGLGVGLGVPLALALGALAFFMCRRPAALPRPAPPPRPAAYLRPAFRPPYPRRMGPRPIF